MRNSTVIWLSIILVCCLIGTTKCRKSDFILEETEIMVNDDGSGTGTVTWTADKSYTLDGFVFVNDGQVLTIEPGTVIRGKTGQGENASALIIARGGKIIAEGTREEPIIFTSEGDDLEGSVPLEARGLWGGVIILGNAPIWYDLPEATIEGLPYYEPRGVFGGFQPDDDSGIMKYVSIRHGGTNIGEGNEINGLTLAGVGSKTTIDYIEIISNEDDGLELFGGCVNVKHIFVAFCGDDAYDYDLGYSGRGQFLVGIQREGLGDRLFENGGRYGFTDSLNYPVFHNVTLYGQGVNVQKPLITFNENSGGFFFNSLMINQGKGIELEKIEGVPNSFEQWKQGNLALEHNWFYNVANNLKDQVFYLIGGFTPEEESEWVEAFSIGLNQIKSAELGKIQGKYFIRPDLVSWGTNKDYEELFFDPVEFKGAMGSVNWARHWTLFDEAGLLAE